VPKRKASKAPKASPSPLHRLPADLKETIESSDAASETWGDITPLARNEWICWVTSAKLEATRQKRIRRAEEDLSSGKRRPCCWPGCPHRRPSARKWF
jgi:uncharacterized protein YdeI (YjbR/CyaY-like superfamily)